MWNSEEIFMLSEGVGTLGVGLGTYVGCMFRILSIKHICVPVKNWRPLDERF